MDGLTLSTTTSVNSCSAIQFFSQPCPRKSRILTFPYRIPRNLFVFASRDDPKFDEWDKMELKFGRMLGEDPKITLAKIMSRKSNPDLSYLEIEKLIEKKKGRALDDEIEEIPFDVSDEKKSTKSMEGLNLVRPVPKKGTRFEATDKPVEANAENSIRPVTKDTKETKSSVPNVILRKKPSMFVDDDGGTEKSSRFGIRPNLSLKMGKDPQKERFTDITLLKKPEPMRLSPEENDHSHSSEGEAGVVDEIGDKGLRYGTASDGKTDAPTLLQKPDLMTLNLSEGEQESSLNVATDNNIDISNSDNQVVTATASDLNQFEETTRPDSDLDKNSTTELQADMSGGLTFSSDGASGSTPGISMDTVLTGKPKRLDRSDKATDQKNREEVIASNVEILGDSSVLENFLTTSPIKHEDGDWARAEALVKTGERELVEVISSSTRGFVVSFGPLIGFLPYRNLTPRWKFLAFESWLRRKGLDPSMYRQNLGIIGKYEGATMADPSESVVDSEAGSKTDRPITSDMRLEDLLMIYDQEKLKFLSSFVGQKIKASLVLADRNSRRLIFSVKQREKEALIEKRRSLMERLSVGDVVKCCIKKITYFGVFVEVEGVPALIHQTEVSWDTTLDPASYFKVGQIIEAKVHQLDFSMERIFLSLKEITPDPLSEALEAVVGGHDSLKGGLEASQADTEWADVESLIKELQQFDGIQSVSKGRYFVSPGLAPTFQVYLASMFENQYKLLARAGNRVQEVIVQTELGKEELKSAILTCTNRVE
ncbi:hypothetical protein CDL12_11983 [Handroanthus impetiginosus]|uniref:S1 motif domain-containing protein n=1 Tax=Handroanthus impetiginosus TaxID=429701 RepID=A0A2G9HCX1_9LAMI|nr:hypothetical protein CDL12_11983 [Handroanthus impetiginosus]